MDLLSFFCLYNMPHLITNIGSRQSHPLYKKKCSCNGAKGMDREKSPEKTESIPKSYDAIKNASGASTKPYGRK